MPSIPLFPRTTPAYPLALLSPPADQAVYIPSQTAITSYLTGGNTVTVSLTARSGSVWELAPGSKSETTTLYQAAVYSIAYFPGWTQDDVYGSFQNGLYGSRAEFPARSGLTPGLNGFLCPPTVCSWLALHYVAATPPLATKVANPVVVATQRQSYVIGNTAISAYNGQVTLVANTYDTQANALNANPAIIDPAGFATTTIGNLQTQVLAQVNAIVKIATDTATYVQTTINNFKTGTVDPAVAGAIITVNNTITTANAIVTKAKTDAETAAANALLTAGQKLIEIQNIVNGADEAVLAEVAKVQTQINTLKTTTVDPLTAYIVNTVLSGVDSVVFIVNDLKADVDALVASAPGEVDNRYDQAMALVATAQAEVDRISGGAVTAVNNLKTGTADPALATATKMVTDQATFVTNLATQVTTTINNAAAKAVADVLIQKAILEAEAEKQKAAATATVTKAQQDAMATITQVLGILLAEAGAVLTQVGTAVANAANTVLITVANLQAQLGDRPLYFGALSTPVTITSPTDVVVIPIGGLVVTAN